MNYMTNYTHIYEMWKYATFIVLWDSENLFLYVYSFDIVILDKQGLKNHKYIFYRLSLCLFPLGNILSAFSPDMKYS